MTIKRNPAITSDHLAKYTKISKADLVEAFRDFARDVGGFGETDESQWFAELERRVEIVRAQRKAGNSMLHVEIVPDEPLTLFGSDKPYTPIKCPSKTGWGEVECPKCHECRCEMIVPDNEQPPKPVGFVIRRTSWHCFHCAKCKEVAVAPSKLQYAGDGDYDQKWAMNFWLFITEDEWLSGRYEQDGTKITMLVNKHKETLAHHTPVSHVEMKGNK